METRDRHLKLLTETIEAVNSTLDLQEVLSQVATNVASAPIVSESGLNGQSSEPIGVDFVLVPRGLVGEY